MRSLFIFLYVISAISLSIVIVQTIIETLEEVSASQGTVISNSTEVNDMLSNLGAANYIINSFPSLVLVIVVLGIGVSMLVVAFSPPKTEQEIIEPKADVKIIQEKPHKQTYLEYVQERKRIEELIQ